MCVPELVENSVQSVSSFCSTLAQATTNGPQHDLSKEKNSTFY